jgi:xanthine dehydrogenase YagR molybdenum-binding subunit
MSREPARKRPLPGSRTTIINPLGIKGVGEIGIVGVAAAIANAVWHATGKRIRDLPITVDKLARAA